MVQGELAAREDDRPRDAGSGAGAEQHLLQRGGRRHPRHPRRAVGQVRLGGHRARLRGLGGPARGAELRGGLHLRDRPVGGRARAAGRGQRLPDPGAGHRLHLPGQRPLVARGGLHLPQPRRRDRRRALAHPPGAGDPVRQGPGPSAPGGRHPLRDGGGARSPRAGHRRSRPAGPRAHGPASRGRLRRHRRRPARGGHLRRRPDGGDGLGGLRRRRQRRRLDRCRRRRDPRRAPPVLEGQRHRPGQPRPRGDPSRPDPRAHLERVHLRRHR